MATSVQITMNDTERRRPRIEAQVAYEEASERLACLISQAAAIGRRSGKIAKILSCLELDPKDPLRSEADLLMLGLADYEDITFDSVRKLGNTIVAARKEVTQAKYLAVAMGCKL